MHINEKNMFNIPHLFMRSFREMNNMDLFYITLQILAVNSFKKETQSKLQYDR